jgi:hypothetical protein
MNYWLNKQDPIPRDFNRATCAVMLESERLHWEPCSGSDCSVCKSNHELAAAIKRFTDKYDKVEEHK